MCVPGIRFQTCPHRASAVLNGIISCFPPLTVRYVWSFFFFSCLLEFPREFIGLPGAEVRDVRCVVLGAPHPPAGQGAVEAVPAQGSVIAGGVVFHVQNELLSLCKRAYVARSKEALLCDARLGVANINLLSGMM